MPEIIKQDITAVILAGGEARRMQGNDKGLITLNNKPLIEFIITKLRAQAGSIIINANRNLDMYSSYGYPVISDALSGFHGPLAGIVSAMQYCDTDYLVSVPCDSPFIPDDLVARLASKMSETDADITVAHNGNRLQPVFCLLKKELRTSLQGYLDAGERKIDKWFKQHRFIEVDFSDTPKAFMNINTPDELHQAEQLLD